MNDTLVVNPLGIRVPEANESRSRIRLRDFAVVALQLGLVLLLLRQFQIESAAFRLLAMLAFAGFAGVLARARLPLAVPRRGADLATRQASADAVVGGDLADSRFDVRRR